MLSLFSFFRLPDCQRTASLVGSDARKHPTAQTVEKEIFSGGCGWRWVR